MKRLLLLCGLCAAPAYTLAQSPSDFGDGIGYYYVSGSQYHLLYWQRQLGTGWTTSASENIQKAASQALVVKKDVRFFAYGIDFSRATGVSPPNLVLGFCYFRLGPNVPPDQAIQGAFPIRAKPVDTSLGPDKVPIYELMLPDFTKTPAWGIGNVYWSIDLEPDCNKGWLFKFVE